MKVCEVVTTDYCMSLKLVENQMEVDFESDVLNYSLGPITWNSEGTVKPVKLTTFIR